MPFSFAFTEAFRQPKALWAMLLVLLLSLLTYNSNGIIRGGGDDDEGSGLGGTGRSLNNFAEPGAGSGLGGTGFRPYLGVNTSGDSKPAELVIIDRPQLGVGTESEADLPTAIAASQSGRQLPDSMMAARIDTPLDNPVRVADPATFTRDSSAISIEESMQWELDQQVLTLEVAQNLLAENRTSNAEAIHAQLTAREPATSAVTDRMDQSAEPEQSGSISWANLVEQLNQQSSTEQSDSEQADSSAVRLAENSEEKTSTAEVMQRPERIQRPALPPVQRIRPVQRAGLLPPRIRPLRL